MKINYDEFLKKYTEKHNPKSRWYTLRVLIIVFIVLTLMFLGIMYLIDKATYTAIINFVNEKNLFILGVIIVIFLVSLASTSSKADADKELINKYEHTLKEYAKEADELLINVDEYITITINIINYYDKSSIINKKHYCWLKDNKLNFYETVPTDILNTIDIKPLIITLDSIKEFKVIGDKYIENKISGGGSQDPNLQAAIVGQALFGTAGAVVGGQQKIDPIKSEIIKHDERQTLVTMLKNEHNIKSLVLEFKFYNFIDEIIPEKNEAIIKEIAKQNIVNKSINNQDDIANKIQLLDKLLKDNLITESEYKEKRQQILNNI